MGPIVLNRYWNKDPLVWEDGRYDHRQLPSLQHSSREEQEKQLKLQLGYPLSPEDRFKRSYLST